MCRTSLESSSVLIPCKYLVNLVNHRHEQFDPPLDSINDVRDGILLANANQLHTSLAFGSSEVIELVIDT